MQATITHKGRSESVTFDILTESGEPQFSVDYGKPELNIYEHGELQPRFNDTRSGLENYTLVAQLVGSSAYDDAIKLADLIKSRTGPGEELTIEVSGNGLTSAYPIDETVVAPAAEQERALELTYAPGRVNVVDVQLSLTRVNAVRGGANQDATTPTSDGYEDNTGTIVRGPLKLTDGANPVEMFEDIAITRTVGRPNSTIRSSPRFDPNYIDHRKTAFDGFDIAFQLLENGPNKAETIARSLIKPPLGRDSLTLDFQGLFNMGQFNVIPDGSQAFRVQRIAGRKDVENAPTLSLRRVIA
jgi:hypothetical protein